MNKLIIIGNLTRDPERRVTTSGEEVADFTVGVNRRNSQNADFFRCTAWGKQAQNCLQYLAKGRKVCVVGPVGVQTWTGQDGSARSSLTVNAQEVEFLTPRDGGTTATGNAPQDQTGYTPVDPGDELPF